MTGSYPFSTAESATYCLVKNAVKMFKDIGVSVHRLWYKSLCLLLFCFYLDLVYLNHLVLGWTLRKAVFAGLITKAFLGFGEEGDIEGEAHQYRFI